MSFCGFNSFLNGKYLNLFIVAAFSSKFFSGNPSLPVKNSYLLEFVDRNFSSLYI